jgi:hypothetical protein
VAVRYGLTRGWDVGTHSMHAQVPLVVGIGLGRQHELVIAPKVAVWQLGGSAGVLRSRSTAIGAGGTLGLSVRVAPNVRILPEVGMVVPVFGRANTRIAFWDVDVRSGVPLYQATVGILLGGDRY